MNDSKSDNAGVIAIPPFVYLGGFLSGLVIDYLYPQPIFPESITLWLGIFFIVASVLIAISAVYRFKKAGTTFDVRKPTTAIVTNGIYRFSRNPMYVSLALLYSGVAIWINSLWIALFLAPVLVIVDVGIIRREEQYLAKKFGDAYLRYKTNVRRWI